jgi:hypothetical protein
MTKHAAEALLVGLIFLACVPLGTKREHVVVAAALAVAAFVVGIFLVATGN